MKEPKMDTYPSVDTKDQQIIKNTSEALPDKEIVIPRKADTINTTNETPILEIKKDLGQIYENEKGAKKITHATENNILTTFKPTKEIKTGSRTLRKVRNATMAFLGTLSMFGGVKAEGTNGDKGKGKEKPKQEQSAKSGLSLWTNESAKTEEGRITPTGKLNGFENSSLTENDLVEIAHTYGFSTASNLSFQTDLYKYLVAHRPDIMKKMIEDAGPAYAGLDENGNLKPDGMLGRRTEFAIVELKKVPTQEKTQTQPEVKKVKEPEGGFIINLRGDEPGSRGAYYFFKTKAEWENALKNLPVASKETYEGDTKGQATVDMNYSVLLSDHPQAAEILGKSDVWERNETNPNVFTIREEGSVKNQDMAENTTTILPGASYKAPNN